MADGRARGGTRMGWLIIGMALVTAGPWFGCSRPPVSEGDKVRAKATVERALASDSYDGFLASFTDANRRRMYRSPVWIKWWQEKIGKNRPAWQVSEVRGARWGKIEVVAESRPRRGNYQFYKLVREGSGWSISEIESAP